MYERTNQPNNQTSEMTAKQMENGSIARTNARKPGDPTNGCFFFEIEEKYWASLV